MEDKELVEALRSGDRQAFGQIYEKYSTELYRTAYLILRNRSDAEDVTQETFVTLWQRAREIKKPESLRYWLIRCAGSKAKDLLRKQRRELPDEEVDKLSEAVGLRNSDDEFANGVVEQEAFYARLYAMPYKYREVLVLYYYNELSVKEIAHLTGQFEGTVKSRLYHARERLRKELEPRKKGENHDRQYGMA